MRNIILPIATDKNSLSKILFHRFLSLTRFPPERQDFFRTNDVQITTLDYNKLLLRPNDVIRNGNCSDEQGRPYGEGGGGGGQGRYTTLHNTRPPPSGKCRRFSVNRLLPDPEISAVVSTTM